MALLKTVVLIALYMFYESMLTQGDVAVQNTTKTFTELAYFVSVCRAIVTMSFKKIVLKSTTMMSLNER